MFGTWITHKSYIQKLLSLLELYCLFGRDRVFQVEKSIMKLIPQNLE